MLIPLILIASISIGILIDLFSCYLELRANRVGRGPSGLPVVTLIVFYFLPLMLTGRSVITGAVWLDCVIFFCFHVVVVFLIPVFDKRWRLHS